MQIFLVDEESGYSLGPYDWDDEEGLYYGARFLEEQGARMVLTRMDFEVE